MLTIEIPDDTPLVSLLSALAGIGLSLSARKGAPGWFAAERRAPPAGPETPPRTAGDCPTVARIRAARAGRIA
jgi:hypothetical protein